MLVTKKVSNKVIIRRVASIFTISVFSLALFYVLFSPVIIATTQTVASSSNSFSLIESLSSLLGFGSYQTALAATSGAVTVSVAVGKEVSITAPSNPTMTGTIGGVSGGTSTGSSDFSILNSSELGFNMSVKASQANALATGSYYFTDYSPNATTGTPDYTWAAPAQGTSSFAFAVGADAGANASIKFRNASGTPCGTGTVNSSTNCWSGFNGTTDIPVVSTTAFSATAVTETIAFKAAFTASTASPPNAAMASDTYQATITATVATN